MWVHSLTVDEITFTTKGMFFVNIRGYSGPAPIPGQFFEFHIGKNFYPLLWRPMSVFDHQNGTLIFLVQIRGTGTRLLSQFKSGEKIEIMGPLGNGFPLPSKPVILIGGGTGISPLYFFAKKYPELIKNLIVGFKTYPGNLLLGFLDSLKVPLVIATEDGSVGFEGKVLDVPHLKDLKEVVYACGPIPMLKAIRKAGIEAIASLEDVMACGIGLCFGCAIWHKKEKRYIRTCTEGPVLPLKDIVLPEL